MTTCVVDTSVVASAFFEEPTTMLADALLKSDRVLQAPDLIFPEFANVVWKRASRREISPEDATRLLTDVLNLRLEVTLSTELLPLALELALQTRRSVYDCVYLALAVKVNSTMVTADKRLLNSLAGTPFAARVTSLDKLS